METVSTVSNSLATGKPLKRFGNGMGRDHPDETGCE